MNTEVINEGSLSIVALKGRVDSHNCDQVSDELKSKLPEDALFVIINLAQLEYIASAGLRIMLILQKAMRAKGGEVVLTNPPEFINKILHIAGFDTVFRFFHDVQEAKNNISGVKS